MRSKLVATLAFLIALAIVGAESVNEIQKTEKFVLFQKPGGIDWWESKDYCQYMLGSPLAVPRNQADVELIATWVNGKNAWVGYQDYNQEGVFETVDGVALNAAEFGGSIPWNPGEPNNNAGVSEEHCAHICYWSPGTLWNDLPCAWTEVHGIAVDYFLCGAPQVWRPVFKVMRGKSLPVTTDFKGIFANGPSTPDEGVYLDSFNPSSFDDIPYFRSSFIDKWTEQVSDGKVDRVKVVAYKDGEPQIYFVYSASTDTTSWHSATRYIDSSFIDVKKYSHAEKQWTMQSGAWTDRQFMVWGHAGGCENDEAWMLATFRPSCANWGNNAGERADGDPTIWVSTKQSTDHNGGFLVSNLLADGVRADTLVVFVGHSEGLKYEECLIESHLLDWEAMFVGDDPVSQGESAITVQKNALQSGNGQIKLDVKVTAPYLMGSTFGSVKDLYETKSPNGYLGVTFVLDTADFESGGRLLKNANNCENRVQTDFDGKDFMQHYFVASNTPSDPSALGSVDFLSYPPSNVWDIAMSDMWTKPCGDIILANTFSFDELKQCQGFAFKDNGDSLALQGAFYLAAVSPMPWILKRPGCDSNDCGQYLTYTLLSHELVIEFAKTRQVVSTSDGIKVDLFSSHVVSASFDETDNTFRMSMITSVPNFMSLDVTTAAIVEPQELDLEGTLNGNVDFLDGPLYIEEDRTGYVSGESCLVTDSYRCFQKFTISAKVKNCDTARLFDGNYFFTADFTCKSGQEAVCADYLSDESQTVTLDSVNLKYTEGCDKSVYAVDWSGEIQYFSDETFSGSPLTTATYQKGDTVFVRAVVTNIDNYDVVGMHIGAAYLCGSDDQNLPAQGCLAGANNGIDTVVYDILKDPGLDYRLIHGNNKDTSEDFSFVLPVVADNTFFVHVDCVLDIVSPTRRRQLLRQRLLLNVEASPTNVFQTLIGKATIGKHKDGFLRRLGGKGWHNAYILVGAFFVAAIIVRLSFFARNPKIAALNGEYSPLLA